MRHIYSGKVRDVYELDRLAPKRLLMVATDRVSAFDVVMNETVQAKGQILTAMSCFWMENTADIVPNHLVEKFPSSGAMGEDFPEEFLGRAVIAAEAEMVELECIVRGYLAGSAFKEYNLTSTVHGQTLDSGMLLASRLDEPLFCPSVKNHLGHDENISIEAAKGLFGATLVERLGELSLAIYRRGAQIARDAGIILADTKFEFGYVDGEIVLCDEVLTPDSSRFWKSASYVPGSEPVQYDKQPLRNYLERTGWDKTPPPPNIPPEVLASLSQRYREVYEMITGSDIALWVADAAQATSTARSDVGD